MRTLYHVAEDGSLASSDVPKVSLKRWSTSYPIGTYWYWEPNPSSFGHESIMLATKLSVQSYLQFPMKHIYSLSHYLISLT